MNRPIFSMNALTMLAGLAALALGTVQAVTCQNNLPPRNPDIVYGNNGDGTITDLRRGLMWKKCVEGESGTGCSGTATTLAWAAAQAAAQASKFAGYRDWRVPNIRELQSLAEDCRANPAINDAVFPNDPSSDVWSSSPYANSPGLALEVFFVDGEAGGDSRATAYHVRLVRAGQSFGDLIFRNGFDGGG